MKRLVFFCMYFAMCVPSFAGGTGGASSIESASSAASIVSVGGESGPSRARQLRYHAGLKIYLFDDSAWKKSWILGRSWMREACALLSSYRKVLQSAIEDARARGDFVASKKVGCVLFMSRRKQPSISLPVWFEPFRQAYEDLHTVLRSCLTAAASLKMGAFLPSCDRTALYQEILPYVPRLGPVTCSTCGTEREDLEGSACCGAKRRVVALFYDPESRVLDSKKKITLAWLLSHLLRLKEVIGQCIEESVVA